MNQQINTPTGEVGGIFGIDIVYVLLLLGRHLKKIVWATLLVTLAGGLYALLATPQYYSKATIALKQHDAGGVSMLAFAEFGLMGGASNSLSNKVEILLKGQELAEQVILENDLLPALFPDRWDIKTQAWSDSSKIPTLRSGGSKLRNKVLDVNVRAKQGVIEVGARTSDSLLTKKIVDYYLVALNNRIRANVTAAADSDRRYLEEQLVNTFDPILSEKIRAMVAYQIERAMLVSSQSFEILEKPVVPHSPQSPQRKKIVVLSFLAGLFLSVTGVFLGQGVLQLRRALAAEKNKFKAGRIP